jgi:flagellar hook-associated protein 1 FlgK
MQRALNTTGHNVANADTDGYSRQRVLFETREPTLTGAGWVGSGVRVSTTERLYDDFLAGQVRSSQSSASRQETIYNHASRIDNLLANPDTGLDPALQSFFDAMQGMADEPASIAARQVVLSEGQALVDRFQNLARQYDDMRTMVNQELGLGVETINGLAESIANVNQAIIEARGTGVDKEPLDLLDRRETLLRELSKMIDVSVVKQDDGAYNIFVGNGQNLVVGNTAATLSITQNPVDVTSPDVAITLGGMTQVITNYVSGGKMGGLLEFRSDFLNEGQNQLGLVALGLVEATNAQHVLGIDLYGNQGGDFFQEFSFQARENQNNAGTAVVDIDFASANIGDLTNSDYELVYDGGNLWTLTRLSDGYSFPQFNDTLPIPTMDGFDLSFAGAAVAGDSFLVQPTRLAARGMEFLINNPNELAAAGSLRSAEATDVNGNPVNAGTASISQIDIGSATGIPLAGSVTLQFTNNAGGTGNPGFDLIGAPAAVPTYILYDPASSDRFGKTFPDAGSPGQFAAYGDLTFDINGVPVVGDEFVIENNTSGTADNRNALSLAQMQSNLLMIGGSATFQNAYGQLVSDVGSMTHYAEVNYQSQEGLLQSHEEALLSISGVNLDEEAANLMKYQQMYQANAQVFSVAGTIFDELLSAVRR